MEVLAGSLPPYTERKQWQALERHYQWGPAREAVQGILRHYGTLHYLIETLARPRAKLEDVVYRALLLGYYQILYIPDIPSYAAVSETVNLVSSKRNRKRGGFVNALLRKLLRSGERVEGPAPTESRRHLPLDEGHFLFSEDLLPSPEKPIDHWKAIYSHPSWLLEKWRGQFDDQVITGFLRENNLEPPLFARLNPLLGTAEEVEKELASTGVEFERKEAGSQVIWHLSRGVKLSQLVSIEKGRLYIQDVNAAQVVPLLNVEPGQSVLDLAVAPGGKASQIAGFMKNEGKLVGVDRSAHRLKRTEKNWNRLGVTCGELIEGDGTKWDRGETYQRVLVDVPCSNTGVLRRRPEVRWRMTQDDLKSLAKIQWGLVRQGWKLLEKGGRLVYSTCSALAEENRDLVDRAVKEWEGAKLVEDRLFLPGENGGDGCYMAAIEKE